ncbi:MAG: DEAD/DEAH box helicase family protein, partial [Flavobacterium sp.]|uniref:DEAD/DEAH box helicase family protein n=1 Tax=Flavobacterium sp. TaxID=239 RepID=UPI003BC9E56D
PSNDQGIDLIAENKDGTFWAIQCKYLQDEEQRLSHRAISTFTSLSKLTAKNISYCLVATTADDYAKLYKGNNAIGFINADEWNKLTKENFDNVRLLLKDKPLVLKPYKPKKHQQKALKEAKEHFLKQKHKRGKLVFPCGAGKSLTGYWIKKELNAQSTIVAVPSLSLVKQTLEVYLRESVANKQKIEWLCVCSDEGIGKNDDVVVHTNEIGVPCITDKNFIANWIKTNKKNRTVIFTTYQSGKTIVEAAKIAKAKFDLGIMDEAHKTVGNQEKLFSYLLFDKNIKIDKRIFMTATERRYAGSSENILSMDDVEVYGETFTQMPFKEAISEGILSDYKIITLFISDKEVKQIIEKNAFVKPEGKEWDKETEARTLASMIALRKAMKQFPIHHAVTFHSSIKKAEAFEQSQAVFSKAFPQFKKIDSFHVSGAMATSQRSKIVNEFAYSQKAIITNAKCLTEGVDVPNIDCVLFADPRKSTVDIVQAVGRALRKKEGKQFGYVILPVFTKSKTKEEIIESAEFKEILSTLRALASNDERIIEYFRDISKNGKKNSSNSGLVQFEIDENILETISETNLIEFLQLKSWDKLAKLSWMPFEEAKDYVRKLGMKNQKEWVKYARSIKKPIDIPSTPMQIYKNSGWINMGNWLGTDFVPPRLIEFLNYENANSFVKNLKINSQKEWKEYCLSGQKPINIPSNPYQVYQNNGWIDWGDWLGNYKKSTIGRSYLSFEEAKKFVHKLNLKNRTEWSNYCKSGKKPINIPTKVSGIYKNKGWINWSDWLGTDQYFAKNRNYMSFKKLKFYIKSFKLSSRLDWANHWKKNKRPMEIPSQPHK